MANLGTRIRSRVTFAREHSILISAIIITTLFFDILGLLQQASIIAMPDSFLLSPSSGRDALLEANLVYDGPWNLYVLSASAVFVVLGSFPFRNTWRIAASWPFSTIVIPVVANWLWLTSKYAVIGVGCKVPCTSSGMSGVAMASAGFALVWTLTAVARVFRKVWRDGIESIGLRQRVGVSVIFILCLVWTLLVLLAGTIGQYPGVVLIHLASFSISGLGIGVVLLLGTTLNSSIWRHEW